MNITITGNLGSGKSSVAKIIVKRDMNLFLQEIYSASLPCKKAFL